MLATHGTFHTEGGSVWCQHPQYTEHTKNSVKAEHNAVQKGKVVGWPRSAVCLDAGLSRGAQASLGEGSIWMSRLGIGRWFFTT